MRTFFCLNPLSLLLYLSSAHEKSKRSETTIFYYSQVYEQAESRWSNSTESICKLLKTVSTLYGIEITTITDKQVATQLDVLKLHEILSSVGLKPTADSIDLVSSGLELQLTDVYRHCERIFAHGSGADLLDFVSAQQFLFYNLRKESTSRKTYYGGIYCEPIIRIYNDARKEELIDRKSLYEIIGEISEHIDALDNIRKFLRDSAYSKPIFLYYPTADVKNDEYIDFFLSELDAILLSRFSSIYSTSIRAPLSKDFVIGAGSDLAATFCNPSVVIMPSKSDHRNYMQLWKDFGFEVIELPSIVRNLPMEFFLDLPLWFVGDIGTARFSTGCHAWITSKKWPKDAFYKRFNYERHLMGVFDTNNIGIDLR